ncbi:ABC transporter substrate-binding protein [Actinomadura sp. 3N407]|uniref:ABC transporter substrate-binding protein n=1 Tax=Actinomadura sp. 3N407 TaxID=3457423 RepID=UPI003FCCBAAA
MTIRTSLIVGLAVVTLAAAGCGGKSGNASGRTGDDGVKAGPGVTTDKITVGALTDLTGVYASLGKSLTQSQRLYYDQLNAAGGVCGREIELLVRDHGYDVQKGVSAYTEIAPKVVGISQVIGSPIVSAVLPRLAEDEMLVIPAAWPSSLLDQEYVQIVGGTYDIEMINGIDFLLERKGLEKGDRIGHIYFEGEYGENALAGSRYAAGKAGLTLVEQKIKPTDTDMTAQVTALKSAGVTAILLSAGPKQAASLAGVAAAGGFAVPIVANNPGYTPQLLGTPAAGALEKNFYLVNEFQAPNSNAPGMKALTSAYKAKYPGQTLDNGVSFGYVAAKVFGEALKDACAAKDLTRKGILKAHRAETAFDSGGIAAPLDFSKVGQVGTRQSFIQRPDAKAEGGLVTVGEPLTSQLATGYPIP